MLTLRVKLRCPVSGRRVGRAGVIDAARKEVWEAFAVLTGFALLERERSHRDVSGARAIRIRCTSMVKPRLATN